MSTQIVAPPAADASNFSGYSGTSIDICEKLTALMAQTEKIVLLLDTYVDPDTMLYTQEAIWPGLLPPGSVIAYAPTVTDYEQARREVMMLQRTDDDLEGIDRGSYQALEPGAIWKVAEFLRGRFVVGAYGIPTDGLTDRPPADKGGAENIALTTPQGAMTQHTHYLAGYGSEAGAGPGDLAVRRVAATPVNIESGWKIQTVESGDNFIAPTHVNSRTMGVYTPSDVPGTPPDVTPDPEKDYSTQSHDNMPPFYTLVYIYRTTRMSNPTGP